MPIVKKHTHIAYSAMPPPLQLEGWLLAHYLVWNQKMECVNETKSADSELDTSNKGNAPE